jgi:dTDP-4-dehydrorhamnose 3,5-epimerase
MNVIPTRLPGVVVIEPRVFRDDRGYFFEVWNAAKYAEAGVAVGSVQGNLSCSRSGVLRGLHLQSPTAQSKLITVVSGAIWDVAVDLRLGAPTFGQWFGATLSSENHRQMFVPAGLAHGFVVTGEAATICYQCDASYKPAEELTVLWNDPDLGIEWPVDAPILSAKDHAGLRLRDIAPDRLPQYAG